MKILWVTPRFLHPTNRGGQIRTLEMLRHLHRWHEVHYAALENPDEPEGPRRAAEYCSRFYAVPHVTPMRGSPTFLLQAASALVSSLPLAVSRYASGSLREAIDQAIQRESFDRVVCDFLFAAPSLSQLRKCVLFQHNVETMIWRRHVENAANPVARQFFALQARRMFAYEREVCRAVRQVIAVSPADRDRMKEMFGVRAVADVPTGVDIDYFRPERPLEPVVDLVFVGSMDWLPNIDAMRYFVADILPLIRRRKPDCSVAIVGRKPPHDIISLGDAVPNVKVTGTVPDIRPYFWQSTVSIIPSALAVEPG